MSVDSIIAVFIDIGHHATKRIRCVRNCMKFLSGKLGIQDSGGMKMASQKFVLERTHLWRIIARSVESVKQNLTEDENDLIRELSSEGWDLVTAGTQTLGKGEFRFLEFVTQEKGCEY